MRVVAGFYAGLLALSAVLIFTPAQPADAREAAGSPAVIVGSNVVVVPDARARSVTGWLVVLAGCADEADGQCTGIAHYLEHLLFINRDNEHRSKVAFFADGSGNGWTTHRATTYFQRFPSRSATDAENVDRLIGFFAGLLSEVRVDGPQADRERNVVLQEYQQNTGRNPFARFQVELNRALLPDEPLGQRVIGSPSTIAAFSTATARDFHARWYARNNAYIVLHGPLEPAAVKAAVERHVAPLPEKPLPERDWKRQRAYEPGKRMLRTSGPDVRQAGVYLNRIATFDERPAERGRNDAAMGLLSTFLASELPGSPHDALIERDGLVTQTRLSIGRTRAGTLRLSFSAVPAPGIDPERVIDAARDYLEALWRSGLRAETIDRLKARTRIGRDLLAQQPAQYAQALTGWLASHGTLEEWRERQGHLEAVTGEHIVRLLAIVTGEVREVAGIMTPTGQVAVSGRERPGLQLPAPAAIEPLPAHRP